MDEWGDLGRCDQCEKEDIPVAYASDPFIIEVYDEYTDEEYWCEECYDRRHGDV